MVTNLILPLFIFLILVVSLIKKVDSYSAFLKGVKEGFLLFNDVFGSMLSMMFAINLLRMSGLLDFIANIFASSILKIEPSLWAMMLFRPFSGTASLAIMIDIFKYLGVDSFSGIMASIIQGSTDTTLYVITLYFGCVGVKKIKNSMAIGLISDIVGISMAILLTFLFFS
ncbi:spore maturation protein [Traorella massiliensis]|uniref:spore maturation protein n=1 Tax=Traorella massiliensis TaxID=1903263 RepID=UPI00235277C9|nr:spore maturation protein [Traorella massiliensis]